MSLNSTNLDRVSDTTYEETNTTSQRQNVSTGALVEGPGGLYKIRQEEGEGLWIRGKRTGRCWRLEGGRAGEVDGDDDGRESRK